MLHLVNKYVYSPEDWNFMQRAHACASLKLGRDPVTHENADRLARTVMNLFNKGLRDEEAIVLRASEEEATASAIGKARS